MTSPNGFSRPASYADDRYSVPQKSSALKGCAGAPGKSEMPSTALRDNMLALISPTVGFTSVPQHTDVLRTHLPVIEHGHTIPGDALTLLFASEGCSTCFAIGTAVPAHASSQLNVRACDCAV